MNKIKLFQVVRKYLEEISDDIFVIFNSKSEAPYVDLVVKYYLFKLGKNVLYIDSIDEVVLRTEKNIKKAFFSLIFDFLLVPSSNHKYSHKLNSLNKNIHLGFHKNKINLDNLKENYSHELILLEKIENLINASTEKDINNFYNKYCI